MSSPQRFPLRNRLCPVCGVPNVWRSTSSASLCHEPCWWWLRRRDVISHISRRRQQRMLMLRPPLAWVPLPSLSTLPLLPTSAGGVSRGRRHSAYVGRCSKGDCLRRLDHPQSLLPLRTLGANHHKMRWWGSLFCCTIRHVELSCDCVPRFLVFVA